MSYMHAWVEKGCAKINACVFRQWGWRNHMQTWKKKLTQVQCCVAGGTGGMLLCRYGYWRNSMFRHWCWRNTLKNRPPAEFLSKETRLGKIFVKRTLLHHFCHKSNTLHTQLHVEQSDRPMTHITKLTHYLNS